MRDMKERKNQRRHGKERGEGDRDLCSDLLVVLYFKNFCQIDKSSLLYCSKKMNHKPVSLFQGGFTDAMT